MTASRLGDKAHTWPINGRAGRERMQKSHLACLESPFDHRLWDVLAEACPKLKGTFRLQLISRHPYVYVHRVDLHEMFG